MINARGRATSIQDGVGFAVNFVFITDEESTRRVEMILNS